MSGQPDFLLQRKACEGSGKSWTPGQLEKMDKSGYFFPAKRIHIFGKTYFMSRSDYNALTHFLFALALMITSLVTLWFAYMGRVR